MRSETVVLPASMWAAMPIFRTLVKSRAIGVPHFAGLSIGGRAEGCFSLHRRLPGSPGHVVDGLTLTTLCFGQHEPARSARSSRGLLLETDTSRYRYYDKSLRNVCRKTGDIEP